MTSDVAFCTDLMLGESTPKSPSAAKAAPSPAGLTASDKAKLTLWELAELGLQKDIAWYVSSPTY